jgi:hypothetical protein
MFFGMEICLTFWVNLSENHKNLDICRRRQVLDDGVHEGLDGDVLVGTSAGRHQGGAGAQDDPFDGLKKLSLQSLRL